MATQSLLWMESINPNLYVLLKDLFSSIKTLAPNSIDSDTFKITETKWLTDNTNCKENPYNAI